MTMKIRMLPETNSSSNHSLIIFPVVTDPSIVTPERVPAYTYSYIKNFFPLAAETFEKIARDKGWDLDDGYAYSIDWDTATAVDAFVPRNEMNKAIAELYANIAEVAVERKLFVEMNFDDEINNPIFPWFGPAFHGGYIRIYKPGNYYVAYMISHNDNNTVFARYKFTDEEKFTPEIPESIDLKITNKCHAMCPFCHENSTPNGEHADTGTIIDFITSTSERPIPEVAIGGGNPLLHPDIDDILEIFSKITVTGITARDVDYIEYGVPKYAHGYGISLTSYKKLAYLLNNGEIMHGYPVIHVINGVHRTEEVSKAITVYEQAEDYRTIPAVLILGFKHFGRGKNWRVRNTIDIDALMKKHPNTIFSFDDLAIEQLNMKDRVPKEQWDVLYNGRDSEYTMYIDLVKMEYAKNSYSEERYPIKDWNIEKMFSRVRGSP